MSVYKLEIGFRQSPKELEDLLLSWGFGLNRDIESAEPTLRDIAEGAGLEYEPEKVYDWLIGDKRTIEARYGVIIDEENPLLRIDPEISSALKLEIWDMDYKSDMFAMAKAIRDRYKATLYDSNYGKVIRD